MAESASNKLFFAIVVAGASLTASSCYLSHEPPASVADASVDALRDTGVVDARPDVRMDAGCAVLDCYCVDLTEHPECIPCDAICIL